MRVESPRPFQRLFSRYQCDRAECAGRYPRRLEFITDNSCRFCNDPRETIPHLLDSCSGTSAIRLEHGISTQTLVTESPSSLLKIATFDDWLRKHAHFDSEPPSNRIQSTLDLGGNMEKIKSGQGFENPIFLCQATGSDPNMIS